MHVLPVFFRRLRLLIAILAVFSLHLSPVFSQKFPEEPSAFLKGLEEHMSLSKRPDLIEAFKSFDALYKSNRIKPEELTKIVATCNWMAGQNMTTSPNFRYYINAVNAVKNDADTLLFEQWHGLWEQFQADVVRGKTKPATDFLGFSSDFLTERALLLGEGGGVTWKIKGGAFKFSYQEKKPEIRLENTRLVGLRGNDSLEILNMTGSYFPTEEKLMGRSGKVTWQRVGLDSAVYVTLKNYDIEVRKTLYKCDDAEFSYPLYFPGKIIKGKFEDNLIVSNKTTLPSYPVFESTDQDLEIGKIGEGIRYQGGFKLRGASVYGFGTFEKPAKLFIVNPQQKPIFAGNGDLFIIRHEESIIAEGITANLILGSDTIVHPSINMKMTIKDGIIDLYRGEKAADRNLFYSTYYNMSLDADKLTWFVKQDSLEIGSRTGLIKGIEQTVTFESRNYFDPAEYMKIQNISSKNPVASLLLLYKQKKDANAPNPDVVSDTDFAKQLDPKWDYANIQTILAELSSKGFIRYNFERHLIQIMPKAFHFAAANQGKEDYDNILITSKTNKSNAQLNLRSQETKVNAVERIEFSKSRSVAAKLLDSEFLLLKNRNMRFNGTLYAGISSLVGKDLRFDYEKFQIEFDSALFLDFYMPTGEVDKRGKPISKPLTSTIEQASGFLLIDAPNNKSGKDKLPNFPSLQVKKPSYVFYDAPFIQKGQYVRDSFFFELKPFPFNGLSNYTKDQLRFKGRLVSSEIFPPFDETIVVRDRDTSYGFVHKTPEAGYPTYQKKGKYLGELDLSNQGLLGKGKVEYLTAEVVSEDITFLPYQMTCTAKKFTMREDRNGAVKTPQAFGEDVAVDWKPYQDSMYVTTKEKPFELFKEKGYKHTGLFILTPSGLKGRGEFEWDGGIMTSKLISYGPFQAKSDTADLKIKALNAKDVAFDSRNINGELDFDLQIGRFKANSDDATTTLPYDQYQTSMNEFTWDMKAQTITFKSDEAKPGRFTSIDPNQDSLTFTGKTAFYDMKSNELRVGGTVSIKSADAFIFPEKGDVSINPGGKMAQFTNAKIEADTVTKYHIINRATVDIHGKKQFTAKGYYEYNIPGYDQEIFFDNIVGDRYGDGLPSEKNLKTTARGSTKESDGFHMDKKIVFKGDIILNSNKPNLRFEGFAKLESEAIATPNWFTVRGETDRKNPVIEIRNAKNDSDEPLVTGFYLSREFGELYPRVLNPPYSRTDRPILTCDEMMRYDVSQNIFMFGDSVRIAGGSTTGNRMLLTDNTGAIKAEGKMNIGSGLNYMSVTAAGELRSSLRPTNDTIRVDGDLMTGMQFQFPKQLLDLMLQDIRASSFDAQPIIFTSSTDFYNMTIPVFISTTQEQDNARALLKTNQLMLPKKDNPYNFVLGKHTVKWNPDYQSFVSINDKIPVLSIAGEPINKMLTAYTEYRMPTNGDDRWYIYLKAGTDLWFFFGYQAGIMNVASSSTRFNDALVALKKKDMVFKMPDGETYEIIPVEALTGERFVNRVKEGRN